jgi:hypothetical protein
LSRNRARVRRVVVLHRVSYCIHCAVGCRCFLVVFCVVCVAMCGVAQRLTSSHAFTAHTSSRSNRISALPAARTRSMIVSCTRAVLAIAPPVSVAPRGAASPGAPWTITCGTTCLSHRMQWLRTRLSTEAQRLVAWPVAACPSDTCAIPPPRTRQRVPSKLVRDQAAV